MPRTWIGNFKGPKGDAGEQGLQGPQGPQGISGEKGDPGAVDENTPITFEVPEIYQTPESGNAIKVLFGKIAKGLSDLFAAVGVLASLKTVEKSTLVTAINELAEGKFDVAKIIASTNITEPGFVMDGKTASEALAELYSKTSSNIIIRYITSEGEDIEAHSIANYYIATPNIDGYKAILGVYNSNSASSNIIPYKTSGALTSSNNTLSLSVKNIADGVVHNVIISAHILYVKI